MTKIIAKNLKLLSDIKGEWELTVSLTNKTDVQTLQDLTDIDLLDVTIKKHRNKKTLSQNNYLFVLCDKIAAKLETEKEQIYRLAIRHVGVFELLPLKNKAVEKFKMAWELKGEGWQAIEFRESKLEGYTTLQCYYGSSVYDTQEQSRLINYIVESAKELGIDTMPIEDIERLR